MEKTIGIVAGVGPFAGLDLLGKILKQTAASTDQEHLTVFSISQPDAIPDRTSYLLGQSRQNPAHAIATQFRLLEKMGASVAAIPCNTSHAPPIFDAILTKLRAKQSRLQVLHMPGEVAKFIRSYYPKLRRVGILATTGTCQARVYQEALKPLGLDVLVPDCPVQELIHQAIYDPAYGIKATGHAASKSRRDLLRGIKHLRKQGAEAIILGCTELPLAIPENHINDIAVIDATVILARALVRESNPDKLKPLNP